MNKSHILLKKTQKILSPCNSGKVLFYLSTNPAIELEVLEPKEIILITITHVYLRLKTLSLYIFYMSR